jgi:hypothetical protein
MDVGIQIGTSYTRKMNLIHNINQINKGDVKRKSDDLSTISKAVKKQSNQP